MGFFGDFFLEAFLVGAACACSILFGLLFSYHIFIPLPIKKEKKIVLSVR